MRIYLSLAVCAAVWATTEALLIIRLDFGIMDLLFLALFGTGCAGTLAFAMLIRLNKQKEDKVD